MFWGHQTHYNKNNHGNRICDKQAKVYVEEALEWAWHTHDKGNNSYTSSGQYCGYSSFSRGFVPENTTKQRALIQLLHGKYEGVITAIRGGASG